MLTSPKVSIIIPVYNGANFLAEAIDSALQQSYDNIEILVVNDGSNDNGATEQIALRYGKKIRYFSKTNGGVGSALNLGIEHMTGNYFSWLSHDDLYYPNKVKNQIDFLKRLNKDDVIIYSDFSTFTHNPHYITPYRLTERAPQHFRYWLTMECLVHGCTLLIPCKAFDNDKFNSTLRTTQDYDLWFRMADKYQFIHLAEVLVNSRRHDEQGTTKMSAIHEQEVDALLKHFVTSLSTKEVLGATKKELGLAYLDMSIILKMRGAHAAAAEAKRISNKYKTHTFISLLIHQCFYSAPKRIIYRVFRIVNYLKRQSMKYIWCIITIIKQKKQQRA